MTAHEFLSQFGTLKDVNVHFVKAGNTVVKPVAELLDDYLAAKWKPAPTAKSNKSKKK